MLDISNFIFFFLGMYEVYFKKREKNKEKKKDLPIEYTHKF